MPHVVLDVELLVVAPDQGAAGLDRAVRMLEEQGCDPLGVAHRLEHLAYVVRSRVRRRLEELEPATCIGMLRFSASRNAAEVGSINRLPGTETTEQPLSSQWPPILALRDGRHKRMGRRVQA